MEKHVGQVCQLHYQFGGWLKYQSSGQQVYVPFKKAPLNVQIGQKVSFSLCSVSATEYEAINISVKLLKQFTCESMEIEHVDHFQEGGRLEAQTKKLQRSMGRFRNADLAEKQSMLTNAEESLDHLLKQTDLDGNAICRIFRRCAGWLKAPLTRVSVKEEPGFTDDSCASNLQVRIRRLLIRALEHLDLTDPVTFRAVESAVTYIKELLEQMDSLVSCALNSSVARRQWARLFQLLGLSIKKKHCPNSLQGAEDDANPKNACMAEVGTSVQKVYLPHEKVRSLRFVSTSENFVQLKCPRCPASISSNWYFRHPRTQELSILIPHHGHVPCKRKFGKTCPWYALDGTPTRTDDFTHLDFCKHNRRKGICKECGGREICAHNRQRFRCKACHQKSRFAKRLHLIG